VATVVQSLLSEGAKQEAELCDVIRRKRKFSPATLARTFVLGFLAKPNASDEELAQTAALCGVEVTPQAIEQRFTPRLVLFLQGLFRRAILCLVQSDASMAPLLDRFTTVAVLDSTTITLPAELSEEFPGCGGSHGGGKAAMKLQVQWDLRHGGFEAIAIEPGRDCDYKTSLQSRALPPGSLRISDLGYFDIDVFQNIAAAGSFWLSRLQFGTAVFSPAKARLSLLEWLGRQPEPVVDAPILLGAEQQMPCRLVAWRVPAEVANRRRQKLIAEARRKDGRTPSDERLAWCDWMIFVTNVPAEQLSVQEIAVLYRARWQIELLFKRWKSQGLVAELTGSTVVRKMVRLWSRLLAVLVLHWLLLTTIWGDPRRSLKKASDALRRGSLVLATALGSPMDLEAAISTLGRMVRVTARQNRRRQTSTFDLLNDPSLLEYQLT
jgi:hypothetical protein